MAVHLAIRPRLTFPTERPAARGRRWRLPPLALPALGYWLAMAALTYGFTQLGPHPLDEAVAAPLAAPTRPEPEPAPELPTSSPAVAVAQPQVEAEPAPRADEPSEPELAAPPTRVAANDSEREREQRDGRKAGRREGFLGSRKEEEEPKAKREEPVARFSFPEFTDSSRPERRERAADGPRIDSLFDRADERPAPDAKPDAPPPVSDPHAPTVVSSCEAAIARNNEQMTIGGARGPADVTREAYASILQNGRYLAGCTIADRTVFEICAAVKDGRAVGITIVSNPASAELNSCVRKAVARLAFPRSSRLDVTHTRFDAAKR